MQNPLERAVDELVNGSPVPTFVIDLDHRIRHWNRACEQLLGYRADQLVGTSDQWKPFYEQPRPVMADLVASGCIDSLIAAYYPKKYHPSRTIPGSYEAEDFFPHLGTEGVWLYFTAAPLRDDAGRIIGAVETLQDITERKRAEEELRRDHQRLKSIIDHFPGGITLMDERLRVVEHNQEFLRLLDLPGELFATGPATLEELLRFNAGRGEYAPGDPEQQVSTILDQARHPAPHMFERVRPNGTVLEVKGTPLPHGGFVTTYTDVTSERRTERRLKAVLDEHRAIFDNAHVGIAYIHGRTILNCNGRMAELFGFAHPGELVGRKTSILYTSETEWREHGERLYRNLAERGCSEDEVALTRQDGATIWCYRLGRPLDPRFPHEGSIWVYSDITEKKRQERELELARTVFDNSTEALMVTDGDNRIISVNQAFTRITGYPPAEVIGQSPSLLKSGHHDDAFYGDMWTTLLSEDRWEGEIWDRRKNGQIYAKWLAIAVVRDGAGGITHFVAAFSDITRRKAAEERVQFLAHHDPLTGLPNRLRLRERFDQAAERARRRGTRVGMLFLDLDQFKRVNDSLGHRIGDALLMAVVSRLRSCLREGDTISRQGGDEFVILIEDVRSDSDVSAVVGKIQACLETTFEIDGHALSTSFSIGIAMFPCDAGNFDCLLQKADTAMYHAKENGRSTSSRFNEQMNAEATERLALHGKLRGAIARNELHLVYQPQIHLRSGRIFGAEALLRWTPEGRPAVPPDRFIPIAEESGQILPIGEWVIHEALQQARRWQDAGLPLRVGINVSGRQVYRSDLPATLAAIQRETAVNPALVEIELTESTLMEDAPTAREVLAALKAAGYGVAIDDFGTGYSSLAYLKKFPLDKLKIDRSFVTELCQNDEDKAIAKAVIQLARTLNLRVIAEGVENAAQLDFLRRQGCHEAQGYFIGRPGAADELVALIRAATGT